MFRRGVLAGQQRDDATSRSDIALLATRLTDTYSTMSNKNSHLSGKDAHLYGAKNTARSKRKEISSSSTVAFSSTLSNLIKASSTGDGAKPTAAGRARPQKDDIFKTHNRNVKKRALADLDDADLTTQKHRGRTSDEKDEDAAAARAPNGADGHNGVEGHGAIVAEQPAEIARLSLSEAVMRLDLAQVPALPFRNSGSGTINLVYRRTDGCIGWIDLPSG